MKLDAHQHFWAYDRAEYAWIGRGMEGLQRDFFPPDLQAEREKAGIQASIAVQARQSLEESRWLLALAQKDPGIHGVVAWADLTSPELGEQLDELKGPKLLGLRHVIQDETDPGFMERPAFLAGLAQLKDRGLAFDLLIQAGQLPVAATLVSRFPGQRFILDHLAKPKIKAGLIEPWKSEIRALARLPNVACKLSGFATEADWKAWKASDFEPYFQTALEAFGPQRLIFGTDWPVCTLAASYGEVTEVVAAFIKSLSQTEQAGIFGLNALRIYGGQA